MTTAAQLRKAALGLPEVVEGTHFGMVAFRVRDKGFASLTKDGWVQVQVSDSDAAAVLEAHRGAERLVRMGTPIGVRVRLADIDGQSLNALLRQAWFARAPKRLAAALRRADAGEPESAGDLPAAIGRAATRALLGAGISTLAQVATRTEQELLDLHGVGPKAVRILGDALRARGLSYADS